jgi:hypothetical protein
MKICSSKRGLLIEIDLFDIIMSKERIICKAPGKVLIAGGYGVL